MRALIAVVVVLVVSAGVALAQPARGIDHDSHDRAAAAAKRTVGCVDCHQVAASGALVGTPSHQWCFGSCHEAPARHVRRQPYTIATGARRLCETCHPRVALDRASSGDPAAFAVATAPSGPLEFDVTLSHAVHKSATCASCHPFSDRAPRPHSRCTSCHQREPVATALPMARCAGCHRTSAAPSIASPFSVGKKFSHRRHAPRTRLAGSCNKCHPGAAEAATMSITAPTKAACVDCHDGQKAFTTKTGCRRCHSSPSTLGERVRAPARVFAHTSHAEAACSSCHDQRGRFMASKGHGLCSQGRCHASDLATRAPVTCSSCHVGTEPWLPQHIDSPTRPTSDFGSRFDHARHQPLAACDGCHTGDPGGADAGLAGGHRSCAGSACHDTGATAPTLTECQRCHVADARTTRRADADKRRWSVRKRFDHRTHRAGPDGSLLVCAACHDVPAKGALSPPAKKTCVPCHDGKTAFKVTGHHCRRCH